MKPISLQNAAALLAKGLVGVIPTDTIYGIVGVAMNRSAVERIYTVKKRTPSKPCIILISSMDDIKQFGIQLSDDMRQQLSSFWPGPVSVIVDCNNPSLSYLHRDTHSLAFRLPAQQNLQDLITQTGPLVAPSANPEASDPAQTVDQAIEYFGDSVDFYVEGHTTNKPSKIIKLTPQGIVVIRE